jgi:hypothetical protein
MKLVELVPKQGALWHVVDNYFSLTDCRVSRCFAVGDGSMLQSLKAGILYGKNFRQD